MYSSRWSWNKPVLICFFCIFINFLFSERTSFYIFYSSTNENLILDVGLLNISLIYEYNLNADTVYKNIFNHLNKKSGGHIYMPPSNWFSNLGGNRFFLVWGSAWNEQHFSTKAEEAQRKELLVKWREQDGKSFIVNRRVLCYNTMLILSVDYLDRLFYENCTFCGFF